MMNLFQVLDKIMSFHSIALWKQSPAKILHKKIMETLEFALALIMRRLAHKLMLVLTQTMPDIF